MLDPKWRKRALIAVAAVAVLAAMAIYRFRSQSFQWDLFLATFSRIDWRWMAVSILLMMLTYPGRALRWELMLRPLGRKFSIVKLTADTMIGFTAVVLLGRPGELVRPYLIAQNTGLPFSSQMAAWLLERMLDLLVVLLLFGFGLTRIPAHGVGVSPGLQWVLSTGGYLVAGIGAACILLLVVFRNFGEGGQRRIMSAVTFLPEKSYKKVERTLAAFGQGMESTRNHGFLALLLTYTAAEWMIIAGSYYALFQSFPTTSHLSFTDVVVILGFVAFGSAIQIPGIGGGMQVATIVVLTELYGMQFEAAAGVALFTWIVTFVVVIPFGFVSAFHQGLNWSKLKHLPEDVPL